MSTRVRYSLMLLSLAALTEQVLAQSDTTQFVHCCDSSAFADTYVFALDADHGLPVYQYNQVHYDMLLIYLHACPNIRLSFSACTGTAKKYKRKGCSPEGPGDLENAVLQHLIDWLVNNGVDRSRLTLTGWDGSVASGMERYPDGGAPPYCLCPVRIKLIPCD